MTSSAKPITRPKNIALSKVLSVKLTCQVNQEPRCKIINNKNIRKDECRKPEVKHLIESLKEDLESPIETKFLSFLHLILIQLGNKNNNKVRLIKDPIKERFSLRKYRFNKRKG
tara:strand:- start:2844 stop:3185 length:342 start_codon:yes stop_codon:yes gene_type:complete